MNVISSTSQLVSVSLHAAFLMVVLWTPAGVDLDLDGDARLREWTRQKLTVSEPVTVRSRVPEQRRVTPDDPVDGDGAGVPVGGPAGRRDARSPEWSGQRPAITGAEPVTREQRRVSRAFAAKGSEEAAPGGVAAELRVTHKLHPDLARELMVESPWSSTNTEPVEGSDEGASTVGRPATVLIVERECWRMPAETTRGDFETTFARCTAAMLADACERAPVCRLIAAATFQ